jgi:hypothetical protein
MFKTENERLPFELGWHKSADLYTVDDLGNAMSQIFNASGVAPEQRKRMLKADIHASFV